jgi:lipopolysaccharide transport system permease protein
VDASLKEEVRLPTLPAGAPGAAARRSMVIEPDEGRLTPEIRALWDSREILYYLIWRDIKVRYKQAVIGAGWALIQPILTVVIFTIVFNRLAKISSDSVPYPLFAFSALIPWLYFSQAIGRGSQSLVSAATMLRKIYFPRIIIPVASALAPVFDVVISLAVLFGLMAYYGIVPGWRVLALPVFLLLAVAAALAVSVWLAPINVRYRDIGYAVPFLVQCWMYLSPIVYPVTLVPERWRTLYSLNPMVTVIEGFRWALIDKGTLDLRMALMSVSGVAAALAAGMVFFRRQEGSLADLV